jgi:integrase
MVIQVAQIKQKKINYFMTVQEAKIIWQHVCETYSTKYAIMMGFMMFRGMRIGEVCAINLYDFQDSRFQKLNIILEKSHILDSFPILGEFNKMLKEYVMKNRHTFKDGYLFPFYTNKRLQHSHIDTKTFGAWFSKVRKALAAQGHTWAVERNRFVHKDGTGVWRYRIGPHSCRRFFETQFWEKHKDKMMLRDIMRYRSSDVVDVYINPYETWKNEQQILDSTFGDLWADFSNVGKGQTKLTSF